MKTSKKKNEKGFTLVELIVAVAIFVIAVVPILYAFVYSTGMNFKSQEVLQSTGISQAIIEKCKSQVSGNDTATYIINSLTPAVPGGPGTGTALLDNTEFVFDSVSNVSGAYFIDNVRKSGLTSSSNRGVYDVRVTFTPAPSTEMIDQSKVDVISSEDCAVFCDIPADGINFSDLRTMDNLAAAEFAERFQIALESSSATFTQVSKSISTAPDLSSDQMRAIFDASISDIKLEKLVIKRTIYLDVANYKVTMRVVYQFLKAFDTAGALSDKYVLVKDFTYNGCVYKIKSEAQLSGSDLTFNGHAIGDESKTSFTLYDKTSSTVQPSALYFYYYPGYDYSGNRLPTTSRAYQSGVKFAGLCNIEDHFEITNSMSTSPVALDIYLFKQYNSGLDSSVFERGENYYLPEIKLSTSSTEATNLYHNLFIRPDTGNELTNGNSFASVWKTGVSNCITTSGTGSVNLETTYVSLGGGSPQMTDIIPTVDNYIPYYTIKVEVWRDGEMDVAGRSAIEVMEGEVLNR